MFFVPSQVYSRDRCHFSLVFQKLYKGTPFVRTRDLSDYSRMLYPELSPRCIQIQKYHCTHAQVVWALLQCFFSSKVYSRDRCHFSLVSKIIQGDTRVRTRDLSDCSRMLYHWAISPLHTDSITSLQTRADCLSTVTMFFVLSQACSRARCHFSLVFQKLYKGTPFVRTRDLSDYSRMLYPELYRRCIQIQKYHCKHAQVVWALLQCFLFPVKCTLAIDVIFL